MAQLFEQINSDLKQAMKTKEAETLSVLRMIVAALRNKEIAIRKAGVAELTDEQIIEVLASEIKKRRDSVLAYEQGGRQDLADKEKSEIKIIEKYLPAQLSEEELEKIVNEVISSGVSDFGRAMGQVMARVKGQADGARVGEIVKRILGK